MNNTAPTPTLSRIALVNVLLLPMTDDPHPIPRAAVHIEGNRIAYAGPLDAAPDFAANRIIDGRGRICLPGLINAHAHHAMTLLRGLGGDLSLMDWLHNAIFPVEDRLDAEAVYYGTLWAIAEGLRYGVTSFVDMYSFEEDVARAVRDSGVRARLARGVVGSGDPTDPALRVRIDESLALAENWHDAADGRIRVAFGPHAEYTTSPEVLRALRGIGRPYGFHIHASETAAETAGCIERHGRTPIAYFDGLGLLGPDTVLAHCVHATEDDIAILARTRTTVAHCPVSNCKLASGVAPVRRMIEAGVNVALGTDGAASNNTLNLFEEVRLAPLLVKGLCGDPTALPAHQALALATRNGAAAVGNPDVGRIEAGRIADIALLDVDGVSALPMPDPMAHAVYGAQGSDVSLTMVDGQVLYEDGRFPRMDMAEVRAGVEDALGRMGLRG